METLLDWELRQSPEFLGRLERYYQSEINSYRWGKFPDEPPALEVHLKAVRSRLAELEANKQ
jgi:hypothetical protein